MTIGTSAWNPSHPDVVSNAHEIGRGIRFYSHLLENCCCSSALGVHTGHSLVDQHGHEGISA